MSSHTAPQRNALSSSHSTSASPHGWKAPVCLFLFSLSFFLFWCVCVCVCGCVCIVFFFFFFFCVVLLCGVVVCVCVCVCGWVCGEGGALQNSHLSAEEFL